MSFELCIYSKICTVMLQSATEPSSPGVYSDGQDS